MNPKTKGRMSTGSINPTSTMERKVIFQGGPTNRKVPEPTNQPNQKRVTSKLSDTSERKRNLEKQQDGSSKTSKPKAKDLNLVARVVMFFEREEVESKFPNDSYEMNELVKSKNVLMNLDFRDSDGTLSPQVIFFIFLLYIYIYICMYRHIFILNIIYMFVRVYLKRI
jgi:hypothetical protein